VADVVLEPAMATVVKEWFAGLAEGDEANYDPVGT
jgi:hypothetical protein